jgi:hypothetical protein
MRSIGCGTVGCHVIDMQRDEIAAASLLTIARLNM